MTGRQAIRRFGLYGQIVGAFLLLSAGSAAAGMSEPPVMTPAAPQAATAFAPLRVDGRGLPTVLSPQDVQLYQDIFTVQDQGKWQAADHLIAQLSDRRLMGHVLEQRYMHPTAYRSRYTELKAWMDQYADHPGANRLYRLALKRRPANYKYPRRPEAPGASLTTATGPIRFIYQSAKPRSNSKARRVASIKRQIRRNVLRTRLTATEQLLQTREVQQLFDQAEIDEGYTRVAAAWFLYGKPDKAFSLAHPAAQRSGKDIAMAHWTAGLAAWRLGEIAHAADHFGSLAITDRESGWNIAAGAYWAARANLRLQKPGEMSRYLRIAAQYPRTFYGLLARRALGMNIDFAFGRHELAQATVAQIAVDPAGGRALALLQIEQRDRAEAELMRVPGWNEPQMAETLLTIAERGGLPHLAYRIGTRLIYQSQPDSTAGALDAALYPIPPWRPQEGFKVDRALIYALIRQESNFNPNAKSPDGARGLMQLMPRTASYMSRERYRGSKRNRLFDPDLNMELGQRYIAYLLDHGRVQGDLFRLATAYNGGPGNLGKWERKIGIDDDPLLFIESLPSRETRLFIERVLSNLWIYRYRLGQPAPSLERLAAGDWPLYVSLDVTRAEVALNATH